MSDHRLASIELDAASLPAASAEIEHERRVAVFDLIEKNSFEPAGAAAGPYVLRMSSQDGRLVFDVSGPDFARAHGLSMSPLNKVIKDYIDICDSYYEVLRGTDVGKIEAMSVIASRMGTDDLSRLLETLTVHRLNIRSAFENILT